MPFEALRFIHAANLVVDHQLHDVGCVPDNLRETIETATLTAFETLVAECVARNVDFLLLAGNSFVASDHSLRGRIALTDGFALLAEHGIQTFVVPGDADPAVEWKSTDQLLANATLFLPHVDEPVAILRNQGLIDLDAESADRRQKSEEPSRTNTPRVRNQRLIDSGGDNTDPRRTSEEASKTNTSSVRGDKLIASIQTADQLDTGRNHQTETAQPWPSRSGPLCIGLVDASYSARVVHEDNSRQSASGSADPVSAESRSVAGTEDYLIHVAGGAGVGPSRSRKIIRRPRGTQGIRPSDTGSRGCTLVEVVIDGSVRETFIPTASVRWEQPTLTVDEHTNWDRLTELMAETINEWNVESSEEVWLIRWSIAGRGSLFDSLGEDTAVNELIEYLESEIQLPDDLEYVHEIRRICDANGFGDALGDDTSFASQYHRSLRLDQTLSRDALDRCLEHSKLPREPWLNRLRLLTPELDCQAISGRLTQKGIDWFVNDSHVDRIETSRKDFRTVRDISADSGTDYPA